MNLFNNLAYKIKRIKESPLSFLYEKSKLIAFSRIALPIFHFNLYKVKGSKKQKKILETLVYISKKNAFSDKASLEFPMYDQLSERVNRVLNGEYECLGFGIVKIGGRNWLRDCIHDASWPLAYFTSIDVIDNSRKSDIKIVWEKSRLQFLVEIAMLAIDDGVCNNQLIDQYFRILEDWDINNPMCFGPNWVVSMEVAIRAANILFSSYLLFSHLLKKQRELIARILYNHYLFLDWFPEISDIEGNHSLATKMGLYLLKSLLFNPSQNHADLFVSYALGQFTDEGFHIEYSPTYHRLCVEMVMVVYANELLINGRTSTQFNLLVKKTVECCGKIAIANSTLPVFGDNDSGHVFNFGQSERDFSYLWNAVMREPVPYCEDESSYIQSKIAFQFWNRFLYGKPLVPSTEISVSSDYVYPLKILRTQNARLIMRIGSLGLMGRAPHDHDDNLSFIFQAFGREIITDRGCPPYTLAPDIREGAISSLSHNVIQAQNIPRSKLTKGSIFKTVRGVPIAEIMNDSGNWDISAALIMNGDGQLFKHHRQVRLSQEDSSIHLCIVDDVVYREKTISEHRFHFANGITLTILNGKVYGETDNLNFIMNFDLEDYSYQLAVRDYNLYERYGSSVIAPLLVIEVEKSNSYKLTLNIHIKSSEL